jgi:hypothetical protein
MTSNTPHKAAPLEMKEMAKGPTYFIGPDPVFPGDAIEVESGQSWRSGSFYWTHKREDPPVLLVAREGTGGRDEGYEMPIPSGTRCRKS